MRQEQAAVQTTEATDTNNDIGRSQIATTQEMLEAVSGLRTVPPTLVTYNPFEPSSFSSTENFKSFDSPPSNIPPAVARMTSSSSSSELGHDQTGRNSTAFGWDVTTMDNTDGALMRNTWIESAIASFNNGNQHLAPHHAPSSAWPKEQRAHNGDAPGQSAGQHSKQQAQFWSASSGPGADEDADSFSQQLDPSMPAETASSVGQSQLQRSNTDNVTGGGSAAYMPSAPSSKEPIWQRRLNSRRQEFFHTLSDSQLPHTTDSHLTSAEQESAKTNSNSAENTNGYLQQSSYGSSINEETTDANAMRAFEDIGDAQQDNLPGLGGLNGYQSSFYGSDKPMLDALMANGTFTGLPSTTVSGPAAGASSQAHYDQSVGAGSTFDPSLMTKPQRSESMDSEVSSSSMSSYLGDLTSSFYGSIQTKTEDARGRGSLHAPTSPRKVTSSLNDDVVHGTINASKGHRRQKHSMASDTTVKLQGRGYSNEEEPEAPTLSGSSFGGASSGGTGVISKMVVSKGSKSQGDSDADEDQEVRHVCPVAGCNKHFSTSGHARRHSRIHAALRPFECPHDGCGATFTRRDNCTQHQRARHNCQLIAHRISAERIDPESRP